MELLIFYVLLALGVSFLCSVLEAVLLSITPGFVQNELNAGKKYAPHLAKMKENVDKPLSAILTLNTIAHTMGAAGAGAQWLKVSKENSAEPNEVIFSIVLTILVLILSEIIPKTLGAKIWRGLAAPTTHILRFLIFVLTWCLILPILRLITSLLGGKGHSDSISRSELAAMAEVSSQSGELDDEESSILKNLFMFKSTQVRDIMTPRTVVYAMRQTTSIDDFLKEAMAKPFSRIPVYEADRDHITGFILKSNVMSARLNGEDKDKNLVDFIRPIKAIAGSDSIFQTFKIMTQEKQHLMLVIDEFGGMDGIVSMEDVVETLLGLEIVDEADRNEDMQVLARNLWQKRAESMGIDPQTSAESPSL